MNYVTTNSVSRNALAAPTENKVASTEQYTGPVEFESSWRRAHGQDKTAGFMDWVSGNPAAKMALGALGSETAKGVGKAALTASAIAGATALGGIALNKVKSQFIDQPQFKQSFDKALRINPELQHYDREQLEDYFNLVAQASPTVAKNPLLISQYLKYLLDYKGSLNFNAFSDLAKLEGQLQNNRSGGSGSVHQVINKGLIEGASKYILDPKKKQ